MCIRMHEALGSFGQISLPDAIEAVEGEMVDGLARVFGFRVGTKVAAPFLFLRSRYI
jgi:hypothetical protein